MTKRKRIEGIVEKAREGWQHWQTFRKIEPGHRFQTRYHLRRQRYQRGETSRYGRVFNLLGGPVLIIAGFVFLPTPGPSYIIIVIGLWMLSGESLFLARAFDWIGVRLRNLWAGSNTVQKVLFFAATLTCIAAILHWLL